MSPDHSQLHRVREAFLAVPRAPFLPDDLRRHAEEDRALPIGHGQTNSQPRTVEAMLAALEVRPGHRVLDVGCGSGWSSALLAHLVAPGGTVLGTELVPELAETARRNLARLARVEVRTADPDVLGAPDRAPFDRILVSAGADSLPGRLVDQLGDRGRLVVPVAGRLTRVDRLGDRVEVTRLPGRYAFVPLLFPDDG